MESHGKPRALLIDGQEYNFVVSCHKCGDKTRHRVLVEISPHKFDTLYSFEPITYRDLVDFIIERS